MCKLNCLAGVVEGQMGNKLVAVVGFIAALIAIFGVIPAMIAFFQPKLRNIEFCDRKNCPEILAVDSKALEASAVKVFAAKSILFSEATALPLGAIFIGDEIDLGGHTHTAVDNVTLIGRSVKNGSFKVRTADLRDGGSALVIAGEVDGLSIDASGAEGRRGDPGRRGSGGRDGRCDGFGRWRAGGQGGSGGSGENGGAGGNGGFILILSP